MHVGNIHEPQAGVDETAQQWMMRMIIQTKTGKAHAAAHATSVDDTADVEPDDPDNEPVDDTTKHNNQDLNEHEERGHDADSSPCFDEISGDNPEDELEPCMGRPHDESNAQSGRLVGSKRNHDVDLQAEPDLLEAGRDDYRTPR